MQLNKSPDIVIRCDLTVQGLGYFVLFLGYCINGALGVCPSCQNMTSMFIGVFDHDQETLIIR
jgi:hypothetical protein